MGTKTISISDDAYDRLKRMKRQGESFTDVIRRLTGRGDLMEYAGTISPGFADELREASKGFRERFDEDAEERLNRLQAQGSGDGKDDGEQGS